MRFAKKYLYGMEHCYATLIAEIDEQKVYLFAPDDVGPCVALWADTLKSEIVWEGPGGTMSIVPIPGRDGEFLASQRFMPGFRAREARIVHMRRQDGRWEVRPWMNLPYVHRFDILQYAGRTWFLGCILSETDAEQADWAIPGCLVVAEMDETLAAPEQLVSIASGMHRNHGYCRTQVGKEEWILTACEEGVYRLTPPEDIEEVWRVSQMTEQPASDVCVCDLDGDGEPELIVISPFHGDRILVYRKICGKYTVVCEIGHHSSFLHAIWAGSLLNRNMVLIGGRDGEKETLLLEYRDGAYCTQVIETGKGASNFSVHGTEILTANREAGECALLVALPD